MARKLRVAANVAAATALLLVTAAPVQAQEDCTRSVVLALPGVLWSDIERLDPPNIVQAIEDGAWGSMSVRTNSSRTSFASGFVTMGAGARVDGGVTTGGPVEEVTPPVGSPVSENVRVAGVGEVEAGASEEERRVGKSVDQV